MQMKTLRNMTLVYLRLLKFDECENVCSNILHMEPNDARLLFRRAEARIGLAKLQEGLGDLSKSRKIAKETGENDLIALIKQQILKLDIEEHKDKYWSVD
jgi:hypothetical protein